MSYVIPIIPWILYAVALWSLTIGILRYNEWQVRLGYWSLAVVALALTVFTCPA